MTVSYQYDVASSSSGGFTRLLFKWKGSVYKLVYRELVWFSVAFAALSIVYRCLLNGDQRRDFERLVKYFDTFLTNYPLSFVVGMYVTLVVTRWWQQFLAIPWPDKIFEKMAFHCNMVLSMIPISFIIGFYVLFVAERFWEQYSAIPWPNNCMVAGIMINYTNFGCMIAHCIALYVSGNDEQDRILRRTLVRYLNLSLILVLRSVSMAVKKRFPTLQHLVEGGFMNKSELEIYQSVPSSEFNTYWIPCTWFTSLVKEARKNKLIPDSQGLKLIMEEFIDYRSKCGLLWSYDWVSIPLVYTQVVTLATYSFFAACVIGRQYVGTEIDLYVPIFTLLQFFFFMGLLKVAEALINPFGDDDEDFELNWIIDRHLKVSYLVVDSLCYKTPPLMKDQYFDDADPMLAYTKAAMMYKKKTFRGSVASAQVPEDEQKMVLPEIMEEEEGSEFSSTFSVNKQSNSFLNLLTWTASHHPQGLGTSPSHGEHRVRRSMSVNDEALQIEISRAAVLGSRHPPTPRPKINELFSGVFSRHSPSTPGTRGSFSQTLDVSSESLAPSAIGDAANLGITSEEDVRVGQHRAGKQPVNLQHRLRSDSGSSVTTTVPLAATSSTDISSTVSRDDIELAYKRKSKSFDLGVVRSASTVSASAVDRIRVPESSRTRSFAPRLRDIKRRRKLRVQQKQQFKQQQQQKQQQVDEQSSKAHQGKSVSQPILSTHQSRQRRWYTWLDVCGNSEDNDDPVGERTYKILATPPRRRIGSFIRTPMSTASVATRSTPEMATPDQEQPGSSDLQSNTTTTTSVCISMPSLHLEQTDQEQFAEDEQPSSSYSESDAQKDNDADEGIGCGVTVSPGLASPMSPPWAKWQGSAENGSLEELNVVVAGQEYHGEQYITPTRIGRRKRVNVDAQQVI